MLLNLQVLTLQWTVTSAILLSVRLFPQYPLCPISNITPVLHTTILSVTDLLTLATDTVCKQDTYYYERHYTSWCVCLEFSQHFFEKFSKVKFHENLSTGCLLVPCGRTGLTKLMVAFCSFANAPKMASDDAEGSTHEIGSV